MLCACNNLGKPEDGTQIREAPRWKPQDLPPAPGVVGAPPKAVRSSPAMMADQLLGDFSEEELVVMFRRVSDSLPGFMTALGKEFGLEASEPKGGLSVASTQDTAQIACTPESAMPESTEPETQHSTDSGRKVPPPILQFSTSIYFATEDSSTVEVEVLRLGDDSTACSVAYQTIDMSAVANIKYKPLLGRLEFKPKEISKILTVYVINDDRWDTTLEFGIQISDPTPGVWLSDTLAACRIKILDDDTFPSNRFRALCKDGRFAEIPRFKQLIEYCKMNLSHKEIKSGVRHIVAFDFVKNVYGIWGLLLRLITVDWILKTSAGDANVDLGEKTIHLLIVASLIFIPQLILAQMERSRVELHVGGQARCILQTNIIRKFLSYEDAVRKTISESDLVVCMNDDCPMVVAKGFFTILAITKEISMLILLMIYQIAVAVGKGTGSPASMVFVLVPTLTFPLCMVVFFRHREPVTTRTLLKRDLARNDFARTVEIVVRNVRLILDFSQRSKITKMVIDGLNRLNLAMVNADTTDTINQLFTPLLISAFVSIYVVFGGRFTLEGQITLGQYITNLEVYATMCTCWSSVYMKLLTVNEALPAVEQVSRYLNLPIDLWTRREAANTANTIFAREREKARTRPKPKGIAYASDTIPLLLDNVGFVYYTLNYEMTVQGSLEIQSEYVKGKTKQPKVAHDEESAVDWKGHAPGEKQGVDVPDGVKCHMREDAMHMRSSLESMESTILWNMTIEQGTLTCLLGRHGDGKGTLLRIIGGVLLPTSGNYFVPPQLRVCFVQQSPVFLQHATLLDTLAFGLSKFSRDDPDLLKRIRLICKEVDVHEEIMAHLESPQSRDWASCLSMAQLKKLHLARAFIANPEVLVLDRPTAALDAKALSKLCELLQRYVHNRGLVDDGSDENDHLQRPRTVVFTTERIEATAIADVIYVVRPNKVKSMKHEDLSYETMYNPKDDGGNEPGS